MRVERKRSAKKMFFFFFFFPSGASPSTDRETASREQGDNQRDDFQNFNLGETPKLKPAKTATNPKGDGRPRGSSNH